MVGFMHYYFFSHEKQNNIDVMGCESKTIKLRGCGVVMVVRRGGEGGGVFRNMTSKLGIYNLKA
jgi:hypothetical protein